MSDTKAKLQRQASRAHEKLRAIEEAERKAVSLKLVGRCFRFRNSYSCPSEPSDYWWLYAVVTGVGAFGHANAFMFQTDKHGKITIDARDMFTGDGWQEIKAEEAALAWTDVQQAIKDSGALAFSRRAKAHRRK